MFEKIVKNFKNEQKYYILKNEQINQFMIFLINIRNVFLFDPDLPKAIKKLAPNL